MPPPPPPPPPPPMCLPFGNNKKNRRLTHFSEKSRASSGVHNGALGGGSRRRSEDAYSPTATLTDAMSLDGTHSIAPTSHAANLTFKSDSEKYDEVPNSIAAVLRDGSGKGKPKLVRGNTMTGTKKSTNSTSKWGYGWGLGKRAQVEKEAMLAREQSRTTQRTLVNTEDQDPVPQYNPPTRSNSRSTQNTRETGRSHRTMQSQGTMQTQRTKESETVMAPHGSPSRMQSLMTNIRRPSQRSYDSQGSRATRPTLYPNDSSSTLVGSALERKIGDVEPPRLKIDTAERLEELRKLMAKDNLDYYVVPSEDAHQSEVVANSDKRREYISGFTGTSGDAVISKTAAYLITDSRYWLQAQEELDQNWTMIPAGSMDGPKDWIDWLVDRVQDSKIGIDARMISHEKATLLNSKLVAKASKMAYPPQNLIDLVWTSKPGKPREPIYLQPIEFSGQEAHHKIGELRKWIRDQPPAVPTYSKGPPTAAQMHVATLITSLPCIAYLLNLRGNDIPYNPLFHAYLFLSLDRIILFVDTAKVDGKISEYLSSLDIEQREYNDLWTWLRKREWGDGKILISPQTSYAISLMLTHFRYTVAPNFVETMMSLKNETELEGLRRAYLRDGAAFTKFLAWLENKLSQGYEITEYEAAQRLTEFRRKSKNFMGLAYQNISASGPNASLPHYTPRRSTARFIDRDTPYLNDSGGQYRDGTCDTTRTVHFGRASPEQCEAYTRVLQGHIAIDTAIFPQGTSGQQLDVLARKALWKDGLNYLHGTGHGFGSFLTVHEGTHGFSSAVPLQPGHVVTNEPGFYAANKWGVRIESALSVRRVKTRGNFNGDTWLGFERLTCVPIQTKMVKENMLTKEEKTWIKEHNQKCFEKLSTYLRDDKRAMKWLKREADRGIGVVDGPGGMHIDWD